MTLWHAVVTVVHDAVIPYFNLSNKVGPRLTFHALKLPLHIHPQLPEVPDPTLKAGFAHSG